MYVYPTTTMVFDANLCYRIKPVRSGSNMLKCASLSASGDVPVADYTYMVWVSEY
jgi:hypothetical protein